MCRLQALTDEVGSNAPVSVDGVDSRQVQPALARSKGKVRIESKGYIMQDGDVVDFRFSN